MAYRALDTQTVVDYLRELGKLDHVFADYDSLQAREVGDGNLNLVFIIENARIRRSPWCSSRRCRTCAWPANPGR